MSETLRKGLEAVCAEIIRHADVLNDLDAVMGDGEHGSNMRKCFLLVNERLSSWKALSGSKIVEQTGMTLLAAGGGTATTLMGFGLMKCAAKLPVEQALWTPDIIAEAVTTSLESLKARSQAVAGDKTLMDALVPAVEAFCVASGKGAPLAECLQQAASAAREGAEATRHMVAKRGRGLYVGERGLGVADPGATSIAIIIERLAAIQGERA